MDFYKICRPPRIKKMGSGEISGRGGVAVVGGALESIKRYVFRMGVSSAWRWLCWVSRAPSHRYWLSSSQILIVWFLFRENVIMPKMPLYPRTLILPRGVTLTGRVYVVAKLNILLHTSTQIYHE